MIRIGECLFTGKLLIFDKDGTLIAFDALWHAWFDAFIARVAQEVPFTLEFKVGLAATLGYEPDDGTWDPEGPLTIASTVEVGLLVAGEIYRYLGKTWNEALDIVSRAEEAARREILMQDLIQPLGDVASLFRCLKERGLLLAIATGDTRASTEASLERLGIASLVDAVVCNDDGFAPKPAPDMALEICRRLNVPPSEAAVIGDTVADLEMARRAGVALAVGVASGANSAEILAPYADCILPDIHAIETVAVPGEL